MKILNLPVLILLLNLIATNVSAQLEKGSIWLGGSIGFSSSRSENQYSTEVKTQSFSFNPAIGKVVKQNLVAGIELFYNNYNEDRVDQEIRNNIYGGGVFVRKYVETFKRVYLFAHAGAIGSVVHNKLDYYSMPDADMKGWQATLSLYPGVSYALNSKVFLEAVFTNFFTIGYASMKTKSAINTNEYTNTSFAANANFNIASNFGVGVRFVLPGKKK